MKMRRVVYDIENFKQEKKRNKTPEDSQNWLFEKRNMALKLINNASALSDAVGVCNHVLEKNPDSELKFAVEKINKVIEELRNDFKKNYTF
jgi:hypothetical protein